MYKNNLRRTVFNETKMMAKEKKKKVQYRIESLDPPGTYRGGASMQMYSPAKKVNKTIWHENNAVKAKDSMYTTIVQVPSSEEVKITKNKELGISKFPIMKRKNKIPSLENAQRIFEAFNLNS